MTEVDADKKWHLDKRVPIALIVMLSLQGGAGIWWASNQSERMTQVERRLDGFSERSENLREQVGQQGTALAVVAARLDDTNRNLGQVRDEIAITNRLLRELLQQPAAGQQ